MTVSIQQVLLAQTVSANALVVHTLQRLTATVATIATVIMGPVVIMAHAAWPVHHVHVQ